MRKYFGGNFTENLEVAGEHIWGVCGEIFHYICDQWEVFLTLFGNTCQYFFLIVYVAVGKNLELFCQSIINISVINSNRVTAEYDQS